MADNHIGYRQYGLESRFKDFKKATSNAFHILHQGGVREVLCGGDFLHMPRPTASTIDYIVKLDSVLKRLKMTLVVIRGNHDYTQPHWIEALFPDRMQNSPRTVTYGINYAHEEFVTLPESGLRVYCLGFVYPDKFRTYQFAPGDILAIHQSVKEFIGFNGGNALSLSELPTDIYNLILVGDTHVTRTEIVGDCHVLSPGSLEMNSTNEDILKYVHVAEFNEENKVENIKALRVTTRAVLSFKDLDTVEKVEDTYQQLHHKFEVEKETYVLVSITYDQKNIQQVLRIKALCQKHEVPFIHKLNRHSFKLVERSDVAEGVSLLELANREINDPEVLDLTTRLITTPEEATVVINDWLDEANKTTQDSSAPSVGLPAV
jgi:DNA repair exonuclease SbcCD nuclease subunit